jgi:hypothetical protein
VIKWALGLVPWWAWLFAAGAAIAGATTWHLLQVGQARNEGRAEVQAQWDDVERQRAERIRAERERRAWLAIEQSKGHEAARAASARNLEEARHAVRTALSAPISCPSGQILQVGDVLLPGAALDGVRRAARAAGQRAD